MSATITQRREGDRLASASTTAARLLAIALTIVAVWWLARQLMPVLLPLTVAILLAALIAPLADDVERRGVPRPAAALLAVATVVLVIATALVVILPPVVSRLSALGDNLQEGLRQITYSVGHDLGGVSHAQANRVVQQALDGLDEHRGELLGDALVGATAIAQALAGILLALFLAFFIVKDRAALAEWALGFVRPERRAAVAGVGAACWSALGTYIRGVMFVATLDAVLIGATLLVVGVPLATPLIVLTWTAAFFPIVGAIVAGVVCTLVALVAEGTGAALVVAGAIILVQQLEGNVLYPTVIGPRLRLHPLAVLLAVTIGATVGGVAGAFLAVPFATVIGVVISERRSALA